MSRCSLVALAAASIVCMQPAAAQTQRNFPQNALRGELSIGVPPEAALNGAPARLAPGARIRGVDNTLVMSSALAGQTLRVNYTVDTLGLVKDVWLLRDDELGKRWPKTADEAAKWQFDPIAQTWTKP